MTRSLAGEAHVYLLSLASPAPEPGRLEGLLSEEEGRRYRAYRFARDRNAYLLAHGLLRSALSRYHRLAPGEWRFEAAPGGRPELANRAVPPLRFSLSRTEGLAACLVVLEAAAGVDVERVRPERCEALEAVLTSVERLGLESLPAAERPERLLALWTLKEAYAKARGLGLQLPFDRFGFTLEGGGIELHAGEELEPRAEAWHFELMRPEAGILVAAAYPAPFRARLLAAHLDPDGRFEFRERS